MTRLQTQRWRAAGWVLSLGEHRPSLQTLHCTPHHHGHGSAHLHTSPAQSHNPLLHTKFSQRPPDDIPRYSIKRLPQVYEIHAESLVGSYILLLQLPDNKNCVCCTSAWVEAKLGIVDWHQLSEEAVHNPLQDFHNLLCQLQTAVVAPFQYIPLSLVEADNETLLPVRGHLAIVNDCSCEVTDHGGAHVNGCSYHLYHYAWWVRYFARLNLRDNLLNYINGDWDGRAFHWWLIRQVAWVPVKLHVEKPLLMLLSGLLLWVYAHWHLSCIILNWFVTNNISVLSSKLISKAVDFWRLGVNILVDLPVGFLTSMVHCISGIAFGCIAWCPSAFTSLPGLESFPFGSNGLFHVFIPPPGFTTPTVGPSCAIHLLVLSSPVLFSSRYPQWPHQLQVDMQVEDLLEMIARLRVFKLTNFEARGKRAWILVAHQSLCRRQEADVSGLLPRQESLLHLWQVCAWSYGIRWSLFAWLCFLTCTWWDGGHVSWNMCSQEAGQMFWHTLCFSHLPHLVPACHTPSHHALPCIQCLHGLHGRSNLHKGSDILMLGSWQAQHAAGQRTGP